MPSLFRKIFYLSDTFIISPMAYKLLMFCEKRPCKLGIPILHLPCSQC